MIDAGLESEYTHFRKKECVEMCEVQQRADHAGRGGGFYAR